MTLECETVVEAYNELGNLLVEQPSLIAGENAHRPGKEYKELLCSTLKIANPRLRCPVTSRFEPGLAAARVLWHISGSRDATYFLSRLPHLSKFVDTQSNLRGSAYGSRIFTKSAPQFLDSLRKLETRENTKQAICVFSEPSMSSETRDLPCAQSLQLLCRDSRLDAVLVMRANDLGRLFLYNFFEFSIFQEAGALRLGKNLGGFNQFTTSMHCYLDVLDRFSPIPCVFVEMPEMPSFDIDAISDSWSLLNSKTGKTSIGELLRKPASLICDYWLDFLIAANIWRQRIVHLEPSDLTILEGRCLPLSKAQMNNSKLDY